MTTRKGAAHAANIMEALTEARRPLSAYDLLDHLRPTGVAAPLTVYRALDKLVQSGKVHRIESLNAFVACKAGAHHDHDHAHPAPHHHAVAFAICDGCGAVDEFTDPHLCDRINAGCAGRGFTPRSSALEIHGMCGGCAAGG